MHHHPLRLSWAAALLIALIGGAPLALAQTAWYEGFEGPEVSWRPAGSNGRYQIDFHRRVPGEAHTGDGCERLRIAAGEGTYVYFSHDIGQARVIDELVPSVQVRSDRSGIQLFVRVVLPRTQDPRTGRPVATLIMGETYNQPGRWQQLRVERIPEGLVRQTRVLRSQLGPNVDPREAYADQVVLNVYGGPGATQVWIDDLDVRGYVALEAVAAEPARSMQTASLPANASLVPVKPRNEGSPVPGQPNRIQLKNSVLLVDDRPTFVRAIQYQGEPLELLKQLGFNAVWLPQLASPEMLEQARQLGLWLICPPPRQPVATGLSAADNAIPPIGRQYDRVLVWDLGGGLSNDRFGEIRQWAEQVRLADRQAGRPLICRPVSELRGYSRVVDLVAIGRSPIGTSLELTDYGVWVRQRPRLMRPGTPIWTTVQTQPAPALVEQWKVLSQGDHVPTTMAAEQIRLMVYTAVTAGSRGLLFESQSPLSAEDADTRQRAMTLELLNLELDLIEPWLAGGNFVTTVPASEASVVGGVLQAERARLLVPMWSAQGAQFVSGQAAGNDLSFIVPGIPETSQAYVLAPGGLEPLRRKRDTGGVRVTIDEFGLTSLVLFTSEPLVVSNLSRRAAGVGPRAAELQRRLANVKLQEVQQVCQRLASSRLIHAQVPGWITLARQNLQQCDGLLASRQYASAYLHAERGMRSLRLVQHTCWQAAVTGLRSPMASPAAVCFRTLPWHRELIERISRGQVGENRLVEGQFEDLENMLHAGWNHFRHPTPGILGEANLTPSAAHTGRFGLRLAAKAATAEQESTLVESPPVWLTSPAVPVEAGELLLIHGWVHIPTPLAGSVDGLLIVDSLSGEPLAERIRETAGWQEFTLYRVAPHSRPLSLTFALSGLGEVWLDDVTIQSVR